MSAMQCWILFHFNEPLTFSIYRQSKGVYTRSAESMEDQGKWVAFQGSISIAEVKTTTQMNYSRLMPIVSSSALFRRKILPLCFCEHVIEYVMERGKSCQLFSWRRRVTGRLGSKEEKKRQRADEASSDTLAGSYFFLALCQSDGKGKLRISRLQDEAVKTDRSGLMRNSVPKHLSINSFI